MLRLQRLPLHILLVGIVMLNMSALSFAQQITAPKLPHEKYKLKNGLTVILHEDHSAPLVAVNLWYHVGSKNEKVRRTGFAHLFEHMMFQGSKNHDTDFFKAVEAIGATDLNGTTNNDRTNYFETVPAHSLERILWIEADRLAFLLPAMTQERLDNQREVVKNERRQGIDNQPYGLVDERIDAAIFPPHHPYSWSTIGSMEDLSAASKKDVEDFFREYYTPNNCTLVIAGDLDPAKTKAMVERYFGSIPSGPPVYRMKEWIPELSREIRLSMEDRVTLPRLYFNWHTPPRFSQSEANLDLFASVLGQGKNSRLYKRLVYDLKIAQDVTVYNVGREISGNFVIIVTAAPGHTLDEIEPVVFEEVEKAKNSIDERELERVRTTTLAGFVRGLERVGGFGGKSDRLGEYETFTGDSNFIEKDFARYQNATVTTVQNEAKRWLHQGRAVMRVVPFPKLDANKEAADLDRAKMPALASEAPLKLPAIQRAKLSNGLEIVLVESHKTPVVQFNLIVNGGSATDKKSGVASFAASAMREGTTKRSALQISSDAEMLGAFVSANAGLDNASVSLDALTAKLDASLELWADVALNPSFPNEEISRMKDRFLGRILQEKNQPQAIAFRILPLLLYGKDHPYGQPLTGSGTEESVRAMTREDLMSFHTTWFKPNNATVVISGDTTMNEIRPKLEKLFSGWKPGDVPKITVPDRAQPKALQVYLIDKPGAAQSSLIAGHLAPSRNDADNIPLRVLNAALGGQFTSRINMNLREDKGYTYGAFTGIFDAKGPAMFFAATEVRTDATKESIVEMLKEIRDIGDKRPLSAEELKFAQSNLTMSLPGEYETNGGINGKLFNIVTYGLGDDYYNKYPAAVKATTVDGLTALAKKRLLPDNLILVVVGDRAVIEGKIRELNLGTIQFLDENGDLKK